MEDLIYSLAYVNLPFSLEVELKEAMFSLLGNSARGPDGFNATFYQS